MINLNDLEQVKAHLNSGLVQDMDVGQLIVDHYQFNTLEYRKVIKSICDQLGKDIPHILALQWNPVFVQAWRKGITLSEAIKTYDYPHGIPNQTRNLSHNHTMCEKEGVMVIQENDDPKCFTPLTYRITEHDGRILYFAESRFMVTAEKQILMFD